MMALPVPLDPEGAAAHAILFQGGFSTPAIEAFRILSDAQRIIKSGRGLDETWKQGVRDTLAWLDEHATDADVVAQRGHFEVRLRELPDPPDWRAVLTMAAT